jgi:hypothetical protein
VAGPSASRFANADISGLLLESDNESDSINFSESSDSYVDYTQENWNEVDEVMQKGFDDNIAAHDSDAQWIWFTIQTSHRGQKLPITGQSVEFWRHFYCFSTSM